MLGLRVGTALLHILAGYVDLRFRFLPSLAGLQQDASGCGKGNTGDSLGAPHPADSGGGRGARPLGTLPCGFWKTLRAGSLPASSPPSGAWRISPASSFFLQRLQQAALCFSSPVPRPSPRLFNPFGKPTVTVEKPISRLRTRRLGEGKLCGGDMAHNRAWWPRAWIQSRLPAAEFWPHPSVWAQASDPAFLGLSFPHLPNGGGI